MWASSEASSAPVFASLEHSVDAEDSPEAREKRIQGASVVSLLVDDDGIPEKVTTVRPLGYGLDEKAIEAVNQYRLKPATYQGAPIPSRITVEVNFHIY